MPVLANLFGTPARVARGMGADDVSALRDIGELLASLREPRPKGLRDALAKVSMLKSALWDMSPKNVKSPACQEVVWEGKDVDLTRLPIQTCWPGDVAPLLTWGLVITRGPNAKRQNLGIYRQQLLGPNKLIMRWLSHARRAGFPRPRDRPSRHALPHRRGAGRRPGHHAGRGHAGAGQPVRIPVRRPVARLAHRGRAGAGQQPVGAGLGRDRARRAPAAGLRPPRPAAYRARGRPASSRHRLRDGAGRPYGDHTGYYNEQDWFPVFTVERITMRRNPIYHSTYTGKPPDEPAVLGVALNEVFVPLLRRQQPEIVDFYLPPEGCSYRLAVVSIRKQYAGHAKRVMFGLWSILRQFMYTKFIVVVDEDIDPRDWKEVVWAMTTRMDPVRDTLLVENTPIDYLDFASPVSGLAARWVWTPPTNGRARPAANGARPS